VPLTQYANSCGAPDWPGSGRGLRSVTYLIYNCNSVSFVALFTSDVASQLIEFLQFEELVLNSVADLSIDAFRTFRTAQKLDE